MARQIGGAHASLLPPLRVRLNLIDKRQAKIASSRMRGRQFHQIAFLNVLGEFSGILLERRLFKIKSLQKIFWNLSKSLRNDSSNLFEN
jgi:hypothetical protein